MNDESAASLEREAETARNQVADTAERLRDKMSPGQMIDEVADYFRNSDGSLALDNLKTQVRDNPLPLALVGAGLAWLFLGGGPTSSDLSETTRGFSQNGDDTASNGELGAPREGSLDSVGATAMGIGKQSGMRGSSHDDAKPALSKAGSKVSTAVTDAYSKAGNAASDATDAVADTMADAKSYAEQTGRRISRASGNAGRQMQNGFLDVLSKEPLVVGAIGIAVGTAIGAMLPSTDHEDENIGPYRDRLRDKAEKKFDEGVEQAKDVASSAYGAVKVEADRQGLKPAKDNSIAERVAKVGRVAAAETEKAARAKVAPKKRQT